MPKFSFSILYFICGIFILWVIFKTLKRKDKNSKILAGALICALVIVVSYGITLVTNNYFVITFFNMFIFGAMEFVLIFLCGYIYYFTNGKKIFVIEKIIVFVIASIDTIILLLNPFFNEFLVSFTKKTINNDIYAYYDGNSFNSYFYIHLAIIYILVISFMCLIVYKCIKSPLVYCEKYIVVSFIFLVIIILNILYYTRILNIPIDISILLFSVYSIVLYYYNYNYQPIFLRSRARSKVMENIRLPFILFDNEGILADVNRAALELLPIDKKEKSILTIEKFKERLGINVKNDEFEMVLYLDGEERCFHGEYDVLKDFSGKNLGEVFIIHNYSVKEELFEELDLIANYDELTGLPNKYNFSKKIKLLSVNEVLPLSIVVININEMKLINKIFGKEMGDQIIKYVATVIKKSLQRKDYIARIDNDFIAFLPNTSKTQAKTIFNIIKGKTETNKFFEMGMSLEFDISEKTHQEEDLNMLIREAKSGMEKIKALKIRNLRDTTIQRYKNQLSQNKHENREHCKRIMELSQKVGKELGMPQSQLKQLELLSFFHDIGNLVTPEELLNKAEMLDENEWVLVKKHSLNGYNIAKSSGEIAEIAFYILSHHERWDGNGYPNRLKGEDIPKLARILAVADSYDVMIHGRPYKPAMSKNEALAQLENCSGSQFDPGIVDIFIKIIKNDN